MLYNKQLLTNEALDMMSRSILVLSGRYHIISIASLVNNCIILPNKEKCSSYDIASESDYNATY